MRQAGFVLDYFENFGAWNEQRPDIALHAYLFRRRPSRARRA
jgi:hypothetical protein